MDMAPKRILLAEDNMADITLFKLTLEDVVPDAVVETARDGCELLSKLRELVDDENASLPDLVVLDLNMPRMNGEEALEALSREGLLDYIYLVILTNSKGHEDLTETYGLDPEAYKVKPLGLDEFQGVLVEICALWKKWCERDLRDSA